MALLLTVHALSTWFMVGLIWLIQIVHYPLFARVGRERFATYASTHTRLVSWVVGPPMLVEAASAAALLLWTPTGAWLACWGGALLLMAVWASTALLQVPAHAHLQKGFDGAVCEGLVRSNWIRTGAWTLRGLVAAWLVWNGLATGGQGV